MAETAVKQPELGGQHSVAEKQTQAEVVSAEQKDLAAISAFLDKMTADLKALSESLTSTHLKVANFRNWLAYEHFDIENQRKNLKD